MKKYSQERGRNNFRKGYIKGIIGLPANLFYGTGIPACIIVIDKENAHNRKGIFMIVAGGTLVIGKNDKDIVTGFGNVKKHPSIPYNPLIASAFFRSGYIEAWGRGIEKINNECKMAGVPAPEINCEFAGLMMTFQAKGEEVSGKTLGKTLAKKVNQGKGESTPDGLNTPAKRVLYNNLGEDEVLALSVHKKVVTCRPDNWKGNETKERVIKGKLYEVLGDEKEVERIFSIIKQQDEY